MVLIVLSVAPLMREVIGQVMTSEVVAPDNLTRIVVPGAGKFQVSDPQTGRQRIFDEHMSTVDGRRFDTTPDSGLPEIEVQAPDGSRIAVTGASGLREHYRNQHGRSGELVGALLCVRWDRARKR